MSRDFCEWCAATDKEEGKIVHKYGCVLYPLWVPGLLDPDPSNYCAKCRGHYTGNPSDHFHKTCVYENGCPTCQQKFHDIHHVTACKARSTWIKDQAGSEYPLLVSYQKKAIASSVERPGLDARCVTDGYLNSRWSSQFTDLEWIMIDLDRLCRVDKVVIDWEAAYAKEHELQFSGDAVNWNVVFRQHAGRGGIEVIPLTSINGYHFRHARFVRLSLFKRATQWGYSIRNLEVFGERISRTTPAPLPDMSKKTPPEQILASEWWKKELPQGTIKIIDERDKTHAELLP